MDCTIGEVRKTIKLEAYETTSIYCLKHLVLEETRLYRCSVDNITLFLERKQLMNDHTLGDYGLIQQWNNSHSEYNENNSLVQYKIRADINIERRKTQLCLDFSFNKINDVRKCQFSQEAPWYRVVEDGFTWFVYCVNRECPIYA